MEPAQTLRFAFEPITSVVPENYSWLSYVVLGFVLFNLIEFGLQSLVYLPIFFHFIRQKEGNIIFKLGITTLFIVVRLTTVYLILLLVPPKLIWDLDFGHAIHPRPFLFIVCFGAIGVFFIFTLTMCFSCFKLLVTGTIRPTRKLCNNKEDKVEAADNLLPTVIVLMPVYNEEPAALIRAVDSIIASDYPSIKQHFFISFDDARESELFQSLIKHLANQAGSEGSLGKSGTEFVVNGVRVTVNRFEHAGKRETQAKSFDIINQLYEKDESARILLLDSDIVLHPNAIYNLVTRNKAVGTTGLITCRTSEDSSLLNCLQDADYVNEQLFIRSTEVLLGGAMCLPGTMTMTDMKTLRKVAPMYFQKVDPRKTIDYHRLQLGEDRYLTFLLLQEGKKDGGVGFQADSHCKTEGQPTFTSLLKQRRRWFLGTLSNDIALLLSLEIWRRVPFVLIFKFFSYGMAGVSLLTWAVCSAYTMTTGNPNNELTFSHLFFYIAIGMFSIKFAINTAVAIQIHRRKVMVFAILFALINSLFMAVVVVYSVWTWNVRSWGGPRTDSKETTKPLSAVKV